MPCHVRLVKGIPSGEISGRLSASTPGLRVLRSSDRDCLIALYLYLVRLPASRRYAGLTLLDLGRTRYGPPVSVIHAWSCDFRIVQRMGLHSSSTNGKYLALEAEMRRRLWWSLMLFDTRTCEMTDYRAVMLTPTWDCMNPLNVN